MKGDVVKSKDTKELLKNSLIELAKKKTIDKITIKQVSENAGVTSQTFYNHFSDKYDMVHWAYKKRVDEIFEKYKNGEIGWKELLDAFLCGYEENSRFILNAFNNTYGEDSYAVKSGTYLSQSIDNELKRRLGVDELDEEMSVLTKIYVSGIINIIAYWLNEGRDIDKDKLIDYIDESMPGKIREIIY